MGRMAMTKPEKNVTVATKIKITETIIFTTVTYGIWSCTVRKKDRKKKMTPLSYGRGEKSYGYPGLREEQTYQFWEK
jgi:hypothetical protein